LVPVSNCAATLVRAGLTTGGNTDVGIATFDRDDTLVGVENIGTAVACAGTVAPVVNARPPTP
jgi:hypothetical protein